MNAMNQIIIEGNVVRAPNLRVLPSGTKVSTMPVAVNHVYKDSSGSFVNETSFFEIETWGEGFTERMTKFALQGRGVRVVGRLKQNRWKDAEGKNRDKIYIVAEHVDFKPLKKGDAAEAAKAVEDYKKELPQEDSAAEQENLKSAAAATAEEAVF